MIWSIYPAPYGLYDRLAQGFCVIVAAMQLVLLALQKLLKYVVLINVKSTFL